MMMKKPVTCYLLAITVACAGLSWFIPTIQRTVVAAARKGVVVPAITHLALAISWWPIVLTCAAAALLAQSATRMEGRWLLHASVVLLAALATLLFVSLLGYLMPFIQIVSVPVGE